MKIVLATPLYPPDIAEPAPYIQELARRLTPAHEVTIATYGRFVEPIPGVRILRVDKRHALPIRLIRFFGILVRALRDADVLYMENGPSVELPGIVASLLTRTPMFMHMGDRAAHARAVRHPLLRALEWVARGRARTIVDDLPDPRPEVIPFRPRPIAQEAAYAHSWDAHVAWVQRILV